MANEGLKKFADELKTAREIKEISLQQVSAKTKIDLKFLKAIEDANFEVLPEIYIRAFIKEFATTIDLNSKEVLNKFDLARSGKPEEKPSAQLEVEKVEEPKESNDIPAAKQFDVTSTPSSIITESEKKPKNLKPNFVIGGSIIFIALVIIYFAFIRDSSPEIIKENIDPVANSESTQRFQMGKPEQSNSASSETFDGSMNPDSLRLSVIATERVWIKISSDGKTKHEKVVPANTRLNYSAEKNFSISVGNAGYVQIFYNNQQIKNIGKLGEIRNIFITPDNIRYYTIVPQSQNEKKSSTKN